MLTETEQTYLVERLTAALSGLGDPRVALGSVLPVPCLERIPYQAFPAGYALEALRACALDRWNNEPCWLLRLLQLLPNEPQTAVIRQRIEKRPNVPNPAFAQVLVTDAPFLDRTSLRQKATALLHPDAPKRILVVSGPPRSGKSYTAEYVQHLHLTGSGFDYCYVEMPRGSGLTCGPAQLANDILVSMGVDVQQLGPSFYACTTNAERWPGDLAASVLNEGYRLGRKYWLVLDAFRGAELREDTRKFINGLADRLTKSSAFAGAFRLILIDFERTNLTVKPYGLFEDEIQEFGSSDVLACVVDIFARLDRVRTAEELQPYVDRILHDLPTGTDRMPELNARLFDLIEELRDGIGV